MAGIYQADIYCDSCTDAIKQRLISEGVLVTGALKDCDPENERTFDSDDYPKYADDDGESDCPQHCGAGEGCLEALVLSDGRKYGKLIGTNLTGEGVKYVLEAVAEALAESPACVVHCNGIPWASMALECWRVEFDFIDFQDAE